MVSKEKSEEKAFWREKIASSIPGEWEHMASWGNESMLSSMFGSKSVKAEKVTWS